MKRQKKAKNLGKILQQACFIQKNQPITKKRNKMHNHKLCKKTTTNKKQVYIIKRHTYWKREEGKRSFLYRKAGVNETIGSQRSRQ